MTRNACTLLTDNHVFSHSIWVKSALIFSKNDRFHSPRAILLAFEQFTRANLSQIVFEIS